MRIRKYPQSCFMIYYENSKILVDPGKIDYKDEYKEDWLNSDLILITHKHGDHCYADLLKEYKGKIYSSAEVQNAYPELNINIVKSGDKIKYNNVNFETVEAKHGYLPRLKNGNEIFENIGFIINVENRKLYFTSDTIIFNNDYKCDILCAPVSNHGLVMGAYEVSKYFIELEAKIIIPCHMDNPDFPVNIDELIAQFKKNNITYKILKYEEEYTI